MGEEEQVQRDLGYHDAKIESLENSVKNLADKVDEALTILNQHKGGVRTLIALGSTAGAIGAVLVETAHSFFTGGHHG